MKISISRYIDVLGEILNIKTNFELQFNKSRSLFNNLERIPSDQQLNYLLKALSLNPYDYDIYFYLLDNYGDRDGSLSSFASNFNYLDKINANKQDILSNIANNYINTPSEMEKVKNKLKNKMDFLGVKASPIYDKFINDLESKMTIHGIKFDLVDDAEKAMQMEMKFDKEIDDLNNLKIDHLSTLISDYDNLKDNIKRSLKMYYNVFTQRYNQLEVEQRTFNGKIYETKAERDIAENIFLRSYNGVLYNTIEEKKLAEEKHIKELKRQEEEENERKANEKKEKEEKAASEIAILVHTLKIDFNKKNKQNYDNCKDILNKIEKKYSLLPYPYPIYIQLSSFIKEYESIKRKAENYEISHYSISKSILKLIIAVLKGSVFFIIFIILAILAYIKINTPILKYIITIWMVFTAIYLLFSSIKESIENIKSNNKGKDYYKRFKKMNK